MEFCTLLVGLGPLERFPYLNSRIHIYFPFSRRIKIKRLIRSPAPCKLSKSRRYIKQSSYCVKEEPHSIKSLSIAWRIAFPCPYTSFRPIKIKLFYVPQHSLSVDSS